MAVLQLEGDVVNLEQEEYVFGFAVVPEEQARL